MSPYQGTQPGRSWLIPKTWHLLVRNPAPGCTPTCDLSGPAIGCYREDAAFPTLDLGCSQGTAVSEGSPVTKALSLAIFLCIAASQPTCLHTGPLCWGLPTKAFPTCLYQDLPIRRSGESLLSIISIFPPLAPPLSSSPTHTHKSRK